MNTATNNTAATAVELEAVMRRVAKLLAIAGDNRGNPEECAAAAGMAERIMRKFQLDHADVVLAAIKTGDDMETVDCVATAKTNGTKVERTPPWAGWLAVAVSKFMGVGARHCHTGPKREAAIRFFGYKADVQMAGWTFDYLIAQVNRLCVEYRTSTAYLVGGRSVMNSYRLGVAHGILATLRKLTAEKEAEARGSSTGTALMVVKADAIVAKFGDVFKTKQASKSTSRSADGFTAGFAAGKTVDVARRAVGNTAAATTGRLS